VTLVIINITKAEPGYACGISLQSNFKKNFSLLHSGIMYAKKEHPFDIAFTDQAGNVLAKENMSDKLIIILWCRCC